MLLTWDIRSRRTWLEGRLTQGARAGGRHRVAEGGSSFAEGLDEATLIGARKLGLFPGPREMVSMTTVPGAPEFGVMGLAPAP